MATPRRDPEPVGKILRSVLARLQPQQGHQRELVQAKLAAALPPRLRNRFRVDEIARGQVVIVVDASALLTEFRSFYLTRILETVQSEPGLESIAKIRFKLGEFHGA